MGVVYMLVFENLHYIGSTIQALKERIKTHKCSYKRYVEKKSKSYCSAYEIIKNDNYEVIVIEEVIGETKEECNEREQLWIDFYGKENLINKWNANGLDKEKIEKRREKKNIQKKEHYENNKEEIIKYRKEYYENNKKEILKKQREQKKEYYKNNKEEILKKIKNKTKSIIN